MKKRLSLVVSLVLCLVFVMSACSGEKNNSSSDEGKSELTVGMIALEFGTQSFNDDILSGLNQAKVALGIDVISLEVPEISDTANSLRTLIGQGANLIIVPTADYRDGMEEVAAETTNVDFIYLSEMLKDAPENIMSIVYRENEAAFLAGALGALLSESDSIGAILAMGEPIQYRYQYGFTAGAKAINPDCEVQVAFTNAYTDVGKGNELAGIMYSKGADFIGTYAGACNLGVFQAAKDAGDGKYVFGAANGQFDQMPDKIVASVVKPVDQAMYKIIEDYLVGNFDTSQPKSLGLKENGVNLLFTPEEALLSTFPQKAISVVEDLKEKIISGEIIVPATEEELTSFTYTYSK